MEDIWPRVWDWLDGVNWWMAITAELIGIVVATSVWFPLVGVLGVIGATLDTAFNTGNLPLNVVSWLMVISWFIGFVILFRALYRQQIPSQAAGLGFSFAVKMCLLSVPLLLVAMVFSDYPLSPLSVVSWIVPILVFATILWVVGGVFRWRAKRKLGV